jgi:nickel transport protein
MKKISWISLLMLLAGVTVPMGAIAHGANIAYQSTKALKINASYDSGQPMSKAEVSIYSPDDPSNPWLTGTTNESGEFIFIPDPDQIGNWEVKVRQAGHGHMITIPVSDSQISTAPASSSSPKNYTPMQKGLMIISVGWGCVGTALFFSRKPLEQSH